jgi:hypothetical protein
MSHSSPVQARLDLLALEGGIARFGTTEPAHAVAVLDVLGAEASLASADDATQEELLAGRAQFQTQFFRAGHAHAGVLLVLSLVYWIYLDRTSLSDGVRWAAGGVLMVGILAQSGGLFLHMLLGAPGQASAGTTLTTIGAVLLGGAVLLLAYAVASAPRST